MIRNLIFLCTSSSLSYLWNLGSFLGITISLQIFTGLLLLLSYNSLESYESIMFIVFEVNLGWYLKIFHSNNASVIFVLLYLHLFKNFSMFSFRLLHTWNSGLMMMLLIMGAAFTGYVLVGSQMSFWAAMVITSLLSVIPLNGEALLYFIWGGYSISWVTYQFLLVAHFILPFLVLGVLFIHLSTLHFSGSTNPNFSHSSVMKLSFYPSYWVKDIISFIYYLFSFIFMMVYSYYLGEVELFDEANPSNSPLHIQPEWYFCAQYAILRSVPSKGMGVILMFLSIGVLFIYPYSITYTSPMTSLSNIVFFELFFMQIWLIFLGKVPIAQPYLFMTQMSVGYYFAFHIFFIFLNLYNSKIFKT